MENRRSYEGENNPFFGKIHSDETCQKMCKSKSEEGKANIKAARLAYSESIKIRKICLGCGIEFFVRPCDRKKRFHNRSCWLKYQAENKLNMKIETRNRPLIDTVKVTFSKQREELIKSLSFISDVISGIYIFINKENNMFYIGSSYNIEMRWKDHLNKLYGNRHENSKLQNAWNKYGDKAFEFKILEAVEPIKELLEKREQYYLDLYKPYEKYIGYNLFKTAYSPLGNKWTEEQKTNLREKIKTGKITVVNPMKGKKHSPEAREAMRKVHEERYAKLRAEGEEPPQTGYHHTEEARQNMSKARKGKTFSPEFCEAIKQRRLGTKLVDGHWIKISNDR